MFAPWLKHNTLSILSQKDKVIQKRRMVVGGRREGGGRGDGGGREGKASEGVGRE